MRPSAQTAGIAIRNLVGISGISLIGVGIWWMYPPASLTTLGILLLSGAIYPYIQRGPVKNDS